MRKRTLTVAVMALAMGLSIAPAGAQTFSVDGLSPTVQDPAFAFLPSDLFTSSGAIGPSPVLTNNGSLFNSPPNLFPIEVNGLSLGRGLNEFTVSPPQVFFSLDRGSRGVAGSASAVEFNLGAGGSEQASDLFGSARTGSNQLTLDGDGQFTAPNPAAPALGIAEAATYVPPIGVPIAGGDLDAFDLRNSVGLPPNAPLYFTVNTATITQGTYGGGSAADVFISTIVAGYDQPPNSMLYVSEAMLGFPVPSLGNEMNALVVFETGDGVYQPGQDIVAFSLAPGASPYLGQPDPISGLPISPGDVLVDGQTAFNLLGSPVAAPAILFTAESLGLLTVRTHGAASDDNLNALDFLPEPGSLAMFCVLAAPVLARRRRRA